MSVTTSYQILPTSVISDTLLEYLDALLEYEINMDYLISLLPEVIHISTEVGTSVLIDTFRETFGVFLECACHDDPQFVARVGGDIDEVSSVVELIINTLEILYSNLCPCLADIAISSGGDGYFNLNFIRWVGDDIMIATTHYRV